MGQWWLDKTGDEYFVKTGLGGDSWMTFKKRDEKHAPRRVKTAALPLRKDEAAAQADLDVWAQKKGFTRK
jgi:hypothetical protein